MSLKYLVTALGLTACSFYGYADSIHTTQPLNQAKPAIADFYGPRPSANALHQALVQSRKLSSQLGQELKHTLQSSIKQSGLAASVARCQLDAPRISQNVEQAGALKAGRTAIKIRNPSNKASSWELKQLNRFSDELQQASRNASPKEKTTLESYRLVKYQQQTALHYMKAIPTGALCLNCHGSTLQAEVANTIKQAYPNDQAYNFKVGELRGAFSIITPIN